MSTLDAARRRLGPRYWEPPLVVTATFLVFVIARYMQWGARREILAKIRVEFLLGVALIICCSALLSSAPVPVARIRRARRVVVGILLLFVAMMIQIPFAADRSLAQTIFVDRVIKFAMLTFFMVTLIRSPNSMRWFMTAFLVACFYVTQEATRGAISGGLVWENQGIMRLHGAVPIYEHPNSLAGIAIGTVPFIVFLLGAVKRRIVRLAMLAPLGTSCACLLYSGSRTGYVAFFAFMVFWWSQSQKKLRWLLVALAVAIVALPVLPEQYVERFKSIGGQEAEGHSKETRIQILRDAWAVFAESPTGVGVASFPAVRMAKFGRDQDTHNLYLEVATNLGIQGLVVFVMLLIALIKGFRAARRGFERIGRNLKRAPPRGLGPKRIAALTRDLDYMRAVALAGEGFIIVRLALGVFGMDLYEVYWWFASGLAISLHIVLYRLEQGFAGGRGAEGAEV